ncbi:MAG: hypothetical protein VKL39_24190 [Leptolyngbyaceae bacterium]|nr:hypothetical protein [Leptolyngbyaceae bacterium]
MKLGLILVYVSGWFFLGTALPEAEFLPYLDKIGTVGLALLIAWLMYKEMGKRDLIWQEQLKTEREESKQDRVRMQEREQLFLKELLARLDEQRLQVNDLIKLFHKFYSKNEKGTDT